MMTLAQAVARRLDQAALVGWRLSRRRQIEITGAGMATLTLGWIGDAALTQAEHGDSPDLDLRDMPSGVTAYVWEAPPDTRDLIAAPSEAELRTAAAALGCRYVDRGDGPDGLLIYWMIK